MIHPTAIVHPGAELDSNVEIGPFSIIADNVYIGSGTVVGPHVIIDPYVSISKDCRIFQYASIGTTPQAIKFAGEKSYVKIGRGCIIREFVTINRGTDFGTGITHPVSTGSGIYIQPSQSSLYASDKLISLPSTYLAKTHAL